MELISKKSVIRILNEEPSYSDALNVLTELEDKVSALPTIEERKTGKWEIEPKHPMDSSTFPHIKCTECGERPFGDFPTLYCPHCGAKMEGAE